MNKMIECTNHGCDYGWDVVGKKITDELWIVGKTMKYCSDDGCCWNVILWVLQSFVVKKKHDIYNRGFKKGRGQWKKLWTIDGNKKTMRRRSGRGGIFWSKDNWTVFNVQ